MTHLAHIADRLLNTPLLILPEKASVIAAVLAGRIGIGEVELSRFEGSPVVIDEQGNAARRPYNVTKDGTAVISITGSLVNRGAWLGAYSGLTSYEGIQHQLKTALTDPQVHNVVLDIHSPGGEAVGAFETAALVRQVAAKKPVTAVVNGVAASAAYAIASGARDIVTTESGVSGSIGVVSLHVDASRQLENEGLKPTLIFAGAHKVDGHPFGPLPDSVREDFQARVDSVYSAFLDTVAAGRAGKLTADGARATEARTYIGAAAVAAGLADRVGTFESVLADLNRARGRTTKGKSMTEPNGGPAANASAGMITKADLDAAVSKATTDAQTSFEARLREDRERMSGIDELAAKVGDNAAGLKLISDAKASGQSVAETALALVKADAFAKAAVVDALKADETTAKGAAPAAAGAAPGAGAKATTPDGWKAEWEASQELKAAYPKVDWYISFKKNEGKTKILEQRRA